MESFVEYCKNYVLDHIEEYEHSFVYGADLSWILTEEPNTNGTLTFSTEKAKEYLREWWTECGEYWEYEKDNFGEHTHNPFDEPEAYMVCMVIEGVASLLANAPVVDEHWNDSFELDADAIASIKEYVEGFDKSLF